MKKPEPYILVIFGASGDLTSRKLIPALFKLYCNDLLPEKFAILGVGRTNFTDDTFRDKLQTSLEATFSESSEKVRVADFFSQVCYQHLDTMKESEYEILTKRLNDIRSALNINANYLFYLATPPQMYDTILRSIHEQGLNEEKEDKYWRRIVVEKPFGKDFESAKSLDNIICSIFKESQVYRIDHYLGKETVQNIMVFRFANGIFEPLWNRNYIDYVEITAVEDMGVLERGSYYDNSGALRDMVQNHMMQLLGITAMEPPAQFNGKTFRDEINKVLESLRPMSRKSVINEVVRGQYTEADTPKGKMAGYREEPNISLNSRTETFVAMRVFIDNWRWSGVPFYIRTGKSMATKVSEIVIHFKPTPFQLFEKQCAGVGCNRLILRILPDEGILLRFGLKKPGSTFEVKQVSMDFTYDSLAESHLPEAYERLLLDCMNGDNMLFARADAVRTSWKFIDPILKVWREDPEIPLYGYPSGSWGPQEADDLMSNGRIWTNPCKNLTNSENYCLL